MKILPNRFFPAAAAAVFASASVACKGVATESGDSAVAPFVAFFSEDAAEIASSRAALSERWHPGFAIMTLETMRFAQSPEARDACRGLLAEKLGTDHGSDMNAWYQEIWSRPENRHPEYPAFKGTLYSPIDRSFRDYFRNGAASTIRLDEIRWGGVVRDGIPPLENPRVIPAGEAEYLADSDVVFGVSFGGAARAYPKRILAWHEMVKDTVGGQKINGVYCTLCSAMIVYDPAGYDLGTSGFLYRSNKLMYDHATRSLWNTLEGKPVVGTLATQEISLEPLHVVTTTWGEWKLRHPETTVLSLRTGHRRDYGEGVAYRDYFASPELMFDISDGLKDRRLPVKEEVFVLRRGSPTAFALPYLGKNPIARHGDAVILTDPSGASRAYEKLPAERWLDRDRIVARGGSVYHVREHALVPEAGGREYRRLPAHRAYWFSWASAHPETALVR